MPVSPFEDSIPHRIIWVSPDGDDSNDGSREAPLRSVQLAIDRATPGTAILLKPGNYTGNFEFDGIQGTAEKPIWLAAADGRGTVSITAASSSEPVISFFGEDNLVIRDLTLVGGSHGIKAAQSGSDYSNLIHNIVIEGNTVVGSANDGIMLAQGVNVHVLNNVVTDVGEEGVDFIGVVDGQIAGNEISSANGTSGALVVKGGSSNLLIVNNYIHNVAPNGIVVGGWSTELLPGTDYEAKNVEVVGNSVDNAGKRPLAVLGARDVNVHDNFFGSTEANDFAVYIGDGGPHLSPPPPSSNVSIHDNVFDRPSNLLQTASSSTSVDFLDNGTDGVIEGDMRTTPPDPSPEPLVGIWPAELLDAPVLWQTGARPDRTIWGTSAADTLTGTDGHDKLAGGGSTDVMTGGKGDDTYDATTWRDVIVEHAGEGVDTVRAWASYTLSDNVENLLVKARGGGNFSGNELNNIITAGAGNDVLTGGEGDDLFVLRANASHDTITDFVAGSAGRDTVDLSVFDEFGDLTDVLAKASQVGTDTTISFASGGSVTLNDVAMTSLTDDDFRFKTPSSQDPTAPTEPSDDPTVPTQPPQDPTVPTELPPDPIVPTMPFENSVPDRIIWVSPDGDDSNSGARDAPLQSLQLAMDRATPGTAILLKPGAYTGNFEFQGNQGTEDKPIWLAAAEGPGTVTLTAASATSPVISFFGEDNLVIQDLTIVGGSHGIKAGQSGSDYSDLVHNIVIKGNTIVGSAADGIKISQGVNIHVVDNSVSNVGEEGVDFVGVVDGQISGNEISNVSGPSAAMFAKGGSSNILISNNYIHDVASDGILVGGWSTKYILPGTDYEAKNVEVVGNSVENVGRRPLAVLGGQDVNVHDNFLGSTEGNDVTVYIGEGRTNLSSQPSSNIWIHDNLFDRPDDVVWTASSSTDVEVFGNSTNGVIDGDMRTSPPDASPEPLVGVWPAELLDAPVIWQTGARSDRTIKGTSGADTLTGTDGHDLLAGGGSTDVMTGGNGDDLYDATTWRDLIVEHAGEGVDTVRAWASFTLSDNVENLLVKARGGGNFSGNELNNIITAGAGNDVLTGGEGDDLFVFRANASHDTITDFVAGSASRDTVDLSAFDEFGDLADVLAQASQIGTDTMISFASGGSLMLSDVAMTSLTDDDLLF